MIEYPHRQSGNVLFFILIAIVLMGILTVAIQTTSQNGSENIDQETLTIRASDIVQFVSEVENAVQFIFQNDVSEVDLRFAHPDAHADYGVITDIPERQIFNRSGGAASYSLPPSGINDGSPWEFYGGTHLPGVGSDKADLVALLPNITQDFCNYVNDKIGYIAQPTDTGTCIYQAASGRFDSGTQFSSSPNTVNTGTFSVTPALRACIECDSDSSLHYVHVIMSR